MSLRIWRYRNSSSSSSSYYYYLLLLLLLLLLPTVTRSWTTRYELVSDEEEQALLVNLLQLLDLASPKFLLVTLQIKDRYS